jgi:hypothetical protein
VIGGGFDAVNHVRASGVARIDADGNVDATWGGWFVEGTLTSSIARAENGLMLVAGSLRTPTGTAATTLLRADGLPEFNAPLAVTPGTKVAPLAPDGDWLAHLAPNETGVRRWQVSPAPDVPLVVPDQPVGIGDEVVFQLNWLGVPVSVAWLRNGEVVPGATGFAYSFIATAEDDGAVFAVRITPEIGPAIYSRPWRLSVVVPEPR